MLDQNDLKIIKELRQNSRQTIRNIAKKTAMRPSTVHQRIQRLKKNNIIEKFTIKLNSKAVGEDLVVFVFVKTEGQLSEKIFHNPHIKEVFGITGEYDLLLKLKFPSIHEFNNFILSFRTTSQVKNTLTMMATVNVKEEF